MLNHRTNVLLDEQTKRMADYAAKKRNQTVGALVRDALKEKLEREGIDKEYRLAVIERIKSRWPLVVQKEEIDYLKLRDEGRK